MEIFSKGLTHDSGQQLQFFPLLAFEQNRPWKKYSGCEDLERYKSPKGGVPQVIKLGVISNNLLCLWNLTKKYVDDTTALEIIPRNSAILLNFVTNELCFFWRSQNEIEPY